MSKPHFMFVPPLVPVPPVPTICERIATNQLAPLGMHWEPNPAPPNNQWVGEESGTTGIHVQYLYADYGDRPPAQIFHRDANFVVGSNQIQVPLNIQDGDAIIVFGYWPNLSTPFWGGPVWQPWGGTGIPTVSTQGDAPNGTKAMTWALLNAPAGNENLVMSIFTGTPAWMSMHVYILRDHFYGFWDSSKALVNTDATPSLSHSTAFTYELILGSFACIESGSPSLRLINLREELSTDEVQGADHVMIKSGSAVRELAIAEDLNAEITGYVDAATTALAIGIRGVYRPQSLRQQYIVMKEIDGSGFYDSEKLALQSP